MHRSHPGPASVLALLAIYDAITEPARWKATLDAVAAAIGAAGGGLYIRGSADRPYQISAMSSVYEPVIVQEYLARKYDSLEASQWAYLNSRTPLDLVFDDRAGVSREVLDKRPDYVFNRERLGIGRRVAMRLNAIPSWYDAAIFGFDAGLGEVPDASLFALRPLLPHLAKSVEVGRAFAMLRSRYQAALAALDRMGVGLAVALPSGEIIVHNVEADRIFACADGLCIGRDRHLRCRRPDQLATIELAIQQASQTLRGGADRPEALEVINRPSGLHPFLVEVTPLADSGGEIERHLAGALVTIIDPDNVPPVNVRRFSALNGLTPAEFEVCAFIIQGLGGTEIAKRRDTTPETVKTQIRAIMAKTGARGRGELIRLVLRTVPPVQ